MTRWPISDEEARRMYAGGRGDETARWYARVWRRAFRTGVLPRRWVVLEVEGRRSGRTRSFPLGLADLDGRWYVVSMLGECAWVANVRAAEGRAVLRRRTPRAVRLVEVPIANRGPILKRYVDKVPGGRPHVSVPKGSPVAAFAGVADQHPVFEVLDAPVANRGRRPAVDDAADAPTG